MMQQALMLFERSEALICWVEDSPEGLTLSIMPGTVKDVLKTHVFGLRMPIVFSSATMSVDGSFRYLADSLGIESFLSFSVASPYAYPEQMEVLAPAWNLAEGFEGKMKEAVRLLQESGGRALILFRTREELRQFKQAAKDEPLLAGIPFYFEGDGEISHLISAFQREEESVLCAVSLWEGLDVPGPSLSNVIIWSLPFPPHDPVFIAKRKAAADPFGEVDLPYMLLRLRQGIGRLIRSRTTGGSPCCWAKSCGRIPRSKRRCCPCCRKAWSFGSSFECCHGLRMQLKKYIVESAKAALNARLFVWKRPAEPSL